MEIVLHIILPSLFVSIHLSRICERVRGAQEICLNIFEYRGSFLFGVWPGHVATACLNYALQLKHGDDKKKTGGRLSLFSCERAGL